MKRAGEHLTKHLYPYLILSMLSWGLSWPTSKMLTRYTDPYTLMFLKFILSAAAILPIVLFVLRPKPLYHPGIVRPLLGASLFMILYNIIFFYGLTIGYAGLAGVIVTGSNPIFTFLIVALISRVPIDRRKKIALAIGLAGTLVTIDIASIDTADIFAGGNLLFLLSSLLWTIATLFTIETRGLVSGILFTLYLYLFMSLVSVLFFVPEGALRAIWGYDGLFWMLLIFTNVINTGFATTFYFYASSTIGADYTSSFIFIVPFAAVLSSNLLLGEIPTHTTLIGGAMLVVAIYLINRRK